jgi:hypothetical protein
VTTVSERVAKPVQPQTEKPKGVLAQSLSWTMGVIGALLVTIAISVVVELTGIAAGWWHGGHAAGLLFVERGYIEGIEQIPLISFKPVVVADHAEERVQAVVGGIYQDALGTQDSDPLSVYLLGAINITQLVVLRLVVTLFTLPGYLVVALAAVIDGGVRRDIRKYTGEHESSYIFHGTKRWLLPGIMGTVSLYLLLPFSVYPALIFAPSMVLFGYLLYVVTGRFKKFI